MNLKSFIDEHCKGNVAAFARSSKLTRVTVYRLINGISPPKKNTVAKVNKATFGLVTERDLLITYAEAQ